MVGSFFYIRIVVVLLHFVCILVMYVFLYQDENCDFGFFPILLMCGLFFCIRIITGTLYFVSVLATYGGVFFGSGLL